MSSAFKKTVYYFHGSSHPAPQNSVREASQEPIVMKITRRGIYSWDPMISTDPCLAGRTGDCTYSYRLSGKFNPHNLSKNPMKHRGSDNDEGIYPSHMKSGQS